MHFGPKMANFQQIKRFLSYLVQAQHIIFILQFPFLFSYLQFSGRRSIRSRPFGGGFVIEEYRYPRRLSRRYQRYGSLSRSGKSALGCKFITSISALRLTVARRIAGYASTVRASESERFTSEI